MPMWFPEEDCDNYFFHCTLYTNQRRQLFRTIDPSTVNISTILHGDNSDIAPASSGWSDDTASGYILHPSTSRCWWREGELSPSEYGNAGANPST